MNRRLIASVVGTMLLLTLLPSGVAAKSPQAGQFTEDGIYIVQMADQPVVAYTGGIKGLKATAPKAGQKIDPTLGRGRRATRLPAAAGTPPRCARSAASSKLYNYVYTYNGFAAKLTAAQANELAADTGVVAVSPDETREADTSSTPTSSGSTPRAACGTSSAASRSAGEGIIIGDIDSGIWPESLSFADRLLNGSPSNVADGQARVPADPRLARQVHPRRGLRRLDLQPEADRRPVVQRGPGRQRRHRRQQALGVQLRP